MLLPWKKQTKLCKRGALSDARLLQLVINHIWRNIKGKGGNGAAALGGKGVNRYNPALTSSRASELIDVAASHFRQFRSRQFCSALRFLIIFRLCLIQSTQVRSGCEMAPSSPQAYRVRKKEKHWISGTVKLTKRHSSWDVAATLTPELRSQSELRGWRQAGGGQPIR